MDTSIAMSLMREKVSPLSSFPVICQKKTTEGGVNRTAKAFPPRTRTSSIASSTAPSESTRSTLSTFSDALRSLA